MTNEELKAALLNNDTVLYGEAEMTMYGIIYRNNGKGGIRVSAELLDKNGNSITVCKPQDIKKL